MARSPVHMRIDSDLLAWVDEYAERRLSNRTAIVHAALRGFREDAEGGVPDLGPAALEETSARRGGESLEDPPAAPARGAPASPRAPRPAALEETAVAGGAEGPSGEPAGKSTGYSGQEVGLSARSSPRASRGARPAAQGDDWLAQRRAALREGS